MNASSIVSPNLPANLQGLHSEEERIRTESALQINASEALREHVELIHSCLDMLHVSHAGAPSTLTDDELVVYGIGIRLFNSGASFLKLVFSGYHQGAVSFLRDIVEVGFLLDYFAYHPDSISRWRAGKDDEFKPFKIRNALDTRDGYKDKVRAERYKFLSAHGTHVTFNGLALVSCEGLLSIGPFSSEKLLAGALFDAASFFSHAVLAYLENFDGVRVDQLKARIVFMENLCSWFVKYRDPAMVAEVVEQIAEIRQLMVAIG